jgi:hypothetical protein
VTTADTGENLRSRILRYLHLRQRAAETAEGINRIWLCRSSAPNLVEEVQHVLDELVEEQKLAKHILPGLVAVYCKPERDESDG